MMSKVIPKTGGLVNAENRDNVLAADCLKEYINTIIPHLDAYRVNRIAAFIQSEILNLPPDEIKTIAG